ncbi:hypothetical protein GCK72_014962 [Caenorhabditis remanei]|uniref:Uncharacterized protein n=1 Tax=Caenorhabditis remanei TaxID=31234 RepID=A0A6A5GV21_CAERE|nr:hypothetical protein GCK72_014962 [Caenorhabditis remanei]KAF1758504.1 hypothetical protein GCK72_014962 [Caenorhabditis remanei]
MMYESRLFLILFALPAGSLGWDHFQFDTTLFCNYNDRPFYDLKIEWWEQDTLSAGEKISNAKILQADTGRFSFTMEGAMNGDEMFSAGYRPVAYISHDCTDDGKRVDLVLSLTTLCEVGHTCHYRVIKDITNTWGKEDMKPAGFLHDNMDPFPDFP